MRTIRPMSTITEEHLALDMATFMRALVAAHRASAQAIESQLAAAVTTPMSGPALLTQRNVEAVAGIPAETYLELLRAPGCPVQVSRIGKLRVVDRASFVKWMKSFSSGNVEDIRVADPEEGITAAAFAAATDMVAVPAPPRSGPRLKNGRDSRSAAKGKGR